MLKKPPPKGVKGRPGKVRVTVDFSEADFEALEALVKRSGARGKAEVLRYLARLYGAILAEQDRVRKEDESVTEEEVYLGLVVRKVAHKIKEPDW